MPLDIYAAIARHDDELRQGACARRDEERAGIATWGGAGDNTFFSALGSLATTAPDDDSPLLPGKTNRGALLGFAAKTYNFYPATPVYHLTAPPWSTTSRPRCATRPSA